MRKGFEIAEDYSGSNIQCEQRCKDRDDCAAFAFDQVLCFLKLFETEHEQGFLKSSVQVQKLDPSIKE